MSRIKLRTSVVFVSVGEETRVFRSADEVPSAWLRRFETSDPHLRPQTILIADQGGRRELLSNLNVSVTAKESQGKRMAAGRMPAPWTNERIAIEVGIMLAVGAAIVAAFWRG